MLQKLKHWKRPSAHLQKSGGVLDTEAAVPVSRLGDCKVDVVAESLRQWDAGTRDWCHCPGPVGPQHCLPNEVAVLREPLELLSSQERSHASLRVAHDPAREARWRQRITGYQIG